jgi:HAD superfamily hydrolase (TIGR01509 family)
MTVSWVLWDVGGVLALVDDASWPGLWEARWAAEFGLAPTAFRARVEAADLPDAAVRAGVEDEWWHGLGAALDADRALLARMRADYWDAYCGDPNTGLIAYAASLAGRVGLAILSNSGDGAREQEEDRFGFSRIFDPICYSHEIGYAKPDPAAYLAALKAMDARPGEVVFVDNAERAVAGARACGITSVLHVDNATTVAAVERALAG